MFQALCAIVVNCAVFAGAGLGPLAVLAPEAGPLAILALAPAAGYALISVALTFWLLREGTVASAMLPVTATLLAVSLACLLAVRQRLRVHPAGLDWRRVLPALAGLILCLGLVTAPLAVGNKGYAVFRGNASDSFIYLYLAKYLDEHPRAWAFSHSAAEIETADPLLGPAPDMLNIRWTAGAMLAYGAHISGQGLLDFQYAFTLISLVIFYAALLPFLSAMGLSPFFSALGALALSTGFYAQFVLDLRAMSQLATLSLSALLAFAASRPEPEGRARAACRVAFLAVAYLACFINYTEIFPMLAGAVAVFVLMKAMVGRLTIREATIHLAGFICGLAAAWPARFLFGHMESQIHFTTLAPQLWSEAYFRWLFTDIPAGIFGLSLAGDAFSITPALSFLDLPPSLVTAAGCAMGLCFLIGAFRAFADSDRDAPLAALAFSGASLAAFGVFLVTGKPWVAGKGLSYFSPFIAALALYAVLGRHGPGESSRPIPRGLVVAGQTLTVLFLVWQLAFAGLRPVYAALDKDYPRYVLNHARYRTVDCELTPIRAALRRAGAKNLAVCSPDPWKWSFLGLSLADNYDVRLPSQLLEGAATDQVFVALDRPVTGAPTELAPYFAAENASFVLYHLPRSVLAKLASGLSCQTNPY